MRSPKNMHIIQIDITNACVHECSNCTRFCGHHKKPYFMDLDYVKKAIDSLEGFDGIFGIMGGEPTLHPDFVEITKYVSKKFEERKQKDLQMLHPQKNFIQTIQDLKALYLNPMMKNGNFVFRSSVPGLWSTMGEKYVENFELIQEVYKMQALNDHGNEMYHDPLLVARKDLKIPDAEWEVLRDNCWIQNKWSAVITPKGAFFCEVAGTLDMLFDGPGGWAVEPNWWKREVSEFKEQLQWCEICGAACDTYTRNANEEVDDVSPTVYEMLEKIGSKKLKNGKVHLMEIDDFGTIAESTKASTKRFSPALPYTNSVYDKFNEHKTKLYPRAFEAIVFQKGNLTKEEMTEHKELFLDQFQTTYYIVETEEMKHNFTVPDSEKCKVFALENDADKNKLFSLTATTKRVYTAVFSEQIQPKKTFVFDLQKYVFNPGALLYTNEIQNNEVLQRFVTVSGAGEFCIFSRSSSSLQNLNGNFSSINTIFDMKEIWSKEKIVPFNDELFLEDTFVQIQKDLRYAMYGTGLKAEEDIIAMQKDGATITCVFDSNTEKHGQKFHGMTIQSPEEMMQLKNEFDIIVISSVQYYIEIQDALLEKGFTKGEFLYYKHRAK